MTLNTLILKSRLASIAAKPAARPVLAIVFCLVVLALVAQGFRASGGVESVRIKKQKYLVLDMSRSCMLRKLV
jgi:hypothetical protein